MRNLFFEKQNKMGCSLSSNTIETENQTLPFEKIFIDKNTYISEKFEEMLYINVENELWDIIHKQECSSQGFSFNKALYRERKFYFDRNNAVYFVHLLKYREIIKKVMSKYDLMYTMTSIYFENEGYREYISIVMNKNKNRNKIEMESNENIMNESNETIHQI